MINFSERVKSTTPLYAWSMQCSIAQMRDNCSIWLTRVGKSDFEGWFCAARVSGQTEAKFPVPRKYGRALLHIPPSRQSYVLIDNACLRASQRQYIWGFGVGQSCFLIEAPAVRCPTVKKRLVWDTDGSIFKPFHDATDGYCDTLFRSAAKKSCYQPSPLIFHWIR